MHPTASLDSIVERIVAQSNADIAFLDHVAEAREEIANLRRQRLDLTAAILRDQVLCELETWLWQAV